ncbi:hypothetical protein CEUSTIGMA_g14063.t1 [Chlamydomonas eustigma]|uniref:Uncharacterized protein n=1 Tax=Chlamydomonas eustigma TaxID=1157962 RepID=A0A250XUA8_9CHLO|nr:hypothetical protein CEUSTIGMA_g14063.t1 [Chlamydomonas eustigma]|eukprot:GAX86655.1 hypothetical protein CEUSTIGMA_g14063.t1 [Chlamydomonas eustigma]
MKEADDRSKREEDEQKRAEEARKRKERDDLIPTEWKRYADVNATLKRHDPYFRHAHLDLSSNSLDQLNAAAWYYNGWTYLIEGESFWEEKKIYWLEIGENLRKAIKALLTQVHTLD